MDVFEQAVQDALDRDYKDLNLKALSAHMRPYVHPLDVVCVYSAKDFEEGNYGSRVFSIHIQEWKRNKGFLGPIITKRLTEAA